MIREKKMNTLEINNYTKIIKGAVILDNIDLKFQSGKIYGFVGYNGSGKTMLFRALCGLIKPTNGCVKYNSQILGKDISVIPKLGVVIENIGLYPEFTGLKNLQLLAGINKTISDEEIKASIRKVGLDPEDKRTVRKYSLGMRQRIVLAQAIMESPDVLILDEPTNALDEDGVNDIHRIIKEEKDRGCIVLIASHNRSDINGICDEIYIMDKGKCRFLKEDTNA
jgi:ABC-2 type transport system ATP-binding protein